MRIIPFLNRHSWYSGRADAYADGELSPAERARFEAHLIECATCQSSVAAASELRNLVEGLPEVEPPRSFFITPQMLTEAPAQVRSMSTPVYLGLARAGAALSVAAFAVVFVLGTVNSNSSSDHTASRESAAPLSSDALAGTPEPAFSDKSAEDEPTPQLAPATAGGGVAGSALIPAPPEATAPDESVNGAAAPAANDAGPVRAADAATPGDDSALTSIGYEAVPGSDSDDGSSKALVATGAIAAVFLVALAALEVTRRARHA
ncbi:MAG: anti-sigma factor [Dehalococcoidia bacterium]